MRQRTGSELVSPSGENKGDRISGAVLDQALFALSCGMRSGKRDLRCFRRALQVVSVDGPGWK